MRNEVPAHSITNFVRKISPARNSSFMSRIPRILVPGVPYHITQRGNARQQVFFEDRDYLLYLDLLKTHCPKERLPVWAYCLMPNHVHLIVVPENPDSMPKAMARIHAEFARYFNICHRSCGHVWQARYHSTPLDEPHLWRAMSYVERNPVRAHLATHAEQYPWSSTQLRITAPPATWIDLTPWQQRYDWPRWQQALRTSIDEEAFAQRLQEASRRGRPLGDPPFLDHLETTSNRRLRPQKVGRRKKASNSTRALRNPL